MFLIEFKERDVVVSHRAHQEAQAAEEATQVWDTLKVGDIKDGAVATVQDFGVFIELGGVQGLLHKSELGQGADVTLPAVGDVVTVRVKSIDRAKERISLGLKDEPTGPWAAVGTDFVEGESYTGTVSRIMDFGAFVKLAEGLEGLVHISQLAHHRVDHPSSVVKQGQEVKVRIMEIDESASALVSACETTAEMAVVRGRSTSATKRARRAEPGNLRRPTGRPQAQLSAVITAFRSSNASRLLPASPRAANAMIASGWCVTRACALPDDHLRSPSARAPPHRCVIPQHGAPRMPP